MSLSVSLQSKSCSKCEEVKTLDEFSKKSIRNSRTSGYRMQCKFCVDLAKGRFSTLSSHKSKKNSTVLECGHCGISKKGYEFNEDLYLYSGYQPWCVSCLSVFTKKCTKCCKNKKLTEFSKNTGTTSGYDYRCKVCKKQLFFNKLNLTVASIPTKSLASISNYNIISFVTHKNQIYDFIDKNMGCVYMLRDSGNKSLKIGFTTNLKNRLCAHSTSNPFLSVVTILQNVDRKAEKIIHDKLCKYRLVGTTEWYKDCHQVLKVFEDYNFDQYLVKNKI